MFTSQTLFQLSREIKAGGHFSGLCAESISNLDVQASLDWQEQDVRQRWIKEFWRFGRFPRGLVTDTKEI